nr:uncharacterized protein LOC107852761 isoform X1 [Ipomoea batatas]
MEPSDIPGGAEGCSSNESGWTMYIASFSQGYDDQDGYEDDHRDSERVRGKNFGRVAGTEHGDSDDSMASDASSGPSYQEICRGLERSHGKEKLKYAGEKGAGKYSAKKHQKEEGVKASKNSKQVREDAHRGKSSYGQSRSFLRKK